MAGLSKHWQACWAVIVRLHPLPNSSRRLSLPGSSIIPGGVAAQQLPCTQLWLFKDCSTAQLRARMYLDGASAHRAGGGQDAHVVSGC